MVDLVITAASVIAGSDATFDTGLCGETSVTAGQQVYRDSSTNKWMKADSNSASPEARVAKATALHAASLNQPLKVQTAGDVTIGATLTGGTAYFLSDTPGGICPFADVGTGEYSEIVGLAISTTVLRLIYKASGVAL